MTAIQMSWPIRRDKSPPKSRTGTSELFCLHFLASFKICVLVRFILTEQTAEHPLPRIGAVWIRRENSRSAFHRTSTPADDAASAARFVMVRRSG